MTTYINDLEELQDILDYLVIEDLPSIFDNNNILDFIETILYIMEDYMNENPTLISEPNFEELFLEDIMNLFYEQFENFIYFDNLIEDDINEIIQEVFVIFMNCFYPERSLNVNTINQYTNLTDEINESENIFENTNEIERKNIIQYKIEKLKNIPQPEQRTQEWYEFRHNLITASNAFKVFESQSMVNQIIYEKCQPINVEKTEQFKMVNTNTPFHWGQKYEPLSVMIYEYLNKTKVGDFGCIQHEKYKFLGASPDGINIDNKSNKYGRMLEIKNIVNREINGIPKKEYWIQMQLQMEVCDLNECDFLETKFIEYPNYNVFCEDKLITDNNEIDETKTSDGNMKGVIIYFISKEGKPFYVYKPLNIIHKKDIEKWEEETLDLYQSDKYKYVFVSYIYWKLEKLSCVLVLRNELWFKNNIKTIENVWNIIEKERITGYEHRAPSKKTKTFQTPIIQEYFSNTGCLINLR
jgi:hypothetical protein